MSRVSCQSLALIGCLGLAFAFSATNVAHAASSEPLHYQQVRKALNHPEPQRRLPGLQKLLKLGTAKDAGLVYPSLGDAEPMVRQVALARG